MQNSKKYFDITDSAAGYLIDSDIIIEILRGNKKIKASFDAIKSHNTNIYYSPVSKAEIFAGAFEKEKDDIKIFFNQMLCLDITDTVGEKAGNFLNSFSKSHNIGLGDALMAATAILYGLELITQNIRHYPMPDITIASI
jgi:predicted nucleic acid-binding protein